MAAQAPRVIPGVPMAALDNIADQNVRDVLRAIVDGWHVRNGASGTGGQRFVTADEVGLAPGRTALNGSYSNQMVAPGSPSITPAQVSRIINDLQAQVIESPLFKVLGERVNLIDKPGGIFDRVGETELVLSNEVKQRADGDTALSTSISQIGTRVGEAEAGLQTETTQRVNAYNALQQTFTTQYTSLGQSLSLVQGQVNTVSNSVSAQSQTLSQVQASVGQNTAAIQQEATARVNAVGEINGKYSVKIDANGYVSGFGLISAANNSTPFSDFTVRADRFAIGSPSGPGITPKVPFIVTTTPQFIGGQLVPPGIYMDMAVIRAASINSAMIGDAEIGTLKLAGNSVTVPQAVSSSSLTSELTTAWMDILDMWVDFGSVAPTLVIVECTVNLLAYDGGGDSSILLRVIQDGGIASMEAATSAPNGFSINIPFSAPFVATGGVHNYKLQVRMVSSATTYRASSRSMIVLGAKR